MAKAPTKKETTKATAKPAPKAKPAPVVEAPAKAPKAAKPPVPKKYEAPAFNAEKFESDHLPRLAVLARTRGEDQQHEGVTVHQDGTYTVA